MASNKENSSEQNISEVVAKLRETMAADSSAQAPVEAVVDESPAGISDDDLQQILRKQFMLDSVNEESEAGDDYAIDEEFLEEAIEIAESPEEESKEEADEELEEEPKEELEEESEEEPEEEPEEELEEELEEEPEEEPEEDLEEEFEEELEEEPEEELEEESEDTNGELPLTVEDIEDSEEAPLTVEDIKDAEEEFGFLDPSLLMHLDEPISEEIISIPRNLNEVEETDEIEEIEKPEDTDEIDEIEEPEEIRIFAPEQIIDPIDPLEEEYSPDIYLYADEEEDGDEDLTFDDLVTDEDADDGLVYENISLESESDDEDLTFDDLATEDNADDGVVYELLSLDDNGEDDDLTFDQLEEAVSEEENDENISYTPILMDSLEQESAESFLGDYFASDSSPLTAVSEVEIDVDAVRERIENAESDSDDDLPWYEDESSEEIIHNTSSEEDDGIGEPEESADFGEFDAEEEFGGFGEGTTITSMKSFVSLLPASFMSLELIIPPRKSHRNIRSVARTSRCCFSSDVTMRC